MKKIKKKRINNRNKKNRRSNDNREQNWYDISFISMFERRIYELLDIVKSQYKSFLNVKDKPHVLDDYTVDRSLIQIRERTPESILLFQRQIDRWKKEAQNESQQKMLKILEQEVSEIKKVNTQMLELVEQLSKDTIDKILEKDDVELALEFLSSKRGF